jgi:serine/threonine protein kinase
MTSLVSDISEGPAKSQRVETHASAALDDYVIDVSSCLAKGRFSKVYACWLKDAPSQLRAVKVVDISDANTESVNRVREEVAVMQMLGEHPNILCLIATDETPTEIRTVFELCKGGELYDRVQRKNFYPESEARLLVRNIISAVEHMHGKGVMHRDLKPENILLESAANDTDVKLSDFGLATTKKRTSSICGSDFYISPEIIKQEEYGREVDMWAVGVITFVLLSGSLPFFHNVLWKLYKQIVTRDLKLPECFKDIPDCTVDFLRQLLTIEPTLRLTAAGALDHPWMSLTSGKNPSDETFPEVEALRKWNLTPPAPDGPACLTRLESMRLATGKSADTLPEVQANALTNDGPFAALLPPVSGYTDTPPQCNTATPPMYTPPK